MSWLPRRVDVEARRLELARALFSVVGEEGLEAASLQRVARELDATTGLVQQYFRSKEELLLFAMERIGELVRGRVGAALRANASAGLRQRLVAAMAVIAGAEDDGPGEGRIWLAFLARAAVDPALRRVQVEGAGAIRAHCTAAFEYAQAHGLTTAELDPVAEGRALAAFADGLAIQRVLEPEAITAAAVRAQLERYLARLLTVDDEHQPGTDR